MRTTAFSVWFCLFACLLAGCCRGRGLALRAREDGTGDGGRLRGNEKVDYEEVLLCWAVLRGSA